MITVRSVRELHIHLDSVCTSLEAVFSLCGVDHEEVENAARPAMQRFRELLNAGDLIAGPDSPEEGAV